MFDDDEVKWIPVQHLLGDQLEPGWQEMKLKFLPIIRSRTWSEKADVLGGLNLRITRLAIASELLHRKGMAEEMGLLERSIFEALINLSFVFFTGPRLVADSEQNEANLKLCRQFKSYSDVAYFKLISSNKDVFDNVYKSKGKMTQDEIDNLYELRSERYKSAIQGDVAKARWHKMDLVTMTEKVLSDCPPFVDLSILKIVSKRISIWNGAVHGDSLSMLNHYKEHGSDLLDLVFKSEIPHGDCGPLLAFEAWRIMGWHYCELEWVNSMIQRRINDGALARYSEA